MCLIRKTTMWLQFRHRLDRVHPYCRVVNHTEAEVRAILLALEQIYRPSFPELNLRQWTGSIYTWLTHPRRGSTKKWACAHGPPDEAGDNGTGVVVCGSRDRCQSQT